MHIEKDAMDIENATVIIAGQGDTTAEEDGELEMGYYGIGYWLTNPWVYANIPLLKDINRAQADYSRHQDIIRNANGRGPAYGDFYELNGVQNLAGFGVNSALGGATRAVAMAHDLTDLYGADVSEDVSY